MTRIKRFAQSHPFTSAYLPIWTIALIVGGYVQWAGNLSP